MAFQLGDDNDAGMNEMNLIPLIDIMLVLMIIFLVTATVANPSIPLTLPKTTADIVDPPPKAITVSINANGEVAWDNQVISLEELQTRFNEAGELEIKPTVQLRADKESRYDMVAQVMSRASEAGLADIAFVSDNYV
ncbi:MAG: biopolymer transporter ExbD, partial [Acinetobacter sp. RIFCSPHIGHO2_12_41_5]